MKKKYTSPNVEINDSINVISTSAEVETEHIPFGNSITTRGDLFEI